VNSVSQIVSNNPVITVVSKGIKSASFARSMHACCLVKKMPGLDRDLFDFETAFFVPAGSCSQCPDLVRAGVLTTPLLLGTAPARWPIKTHQILPVLSEAPGVYGQGSAPVPVQSFFLVIYCRANKKDFTTVKNTIVKKPNGHFRSFPDDRSFPRRLGWREELFPPTKMI